VGLFDQYDLTLCRVDFGGHGSCSFR
jgi:hypothetical protein